MAVTIYTWTYNQNSVAESLLRKTNCGHCSLEISGTKEKIKKIEKSILLRYTEYQRSMKVVEEFLHTPQQIDNFMTKSSEKEKIVARKNDLNECLIEYEDQPIKGLMIANQKEIKKEVIEAAYIIKVRKEKLENLISCTNTAINSNKIYQLYFSFFPEDESITKLYPGSSKESSNNNLYNILCRKKKKSPDFANPPQFHSFEEDCEDEASGIEISKIFTDIRPENLEEDTENSKFRNEYSKYSWDKKNRKLFKVKSGNLKGVTITQATFSEYKNFFNFIFKYKNISFRNLLLDENADINQNIFNQYLKNDRKYFINLFNDLSKNINSLKQQIKTTKSLHEKIILNDKISRLNSIISSLGNIYSTVKNYLQVSGLPPSEVITFPSKICDGYGLDELIILEKWINIVSKCGYNYTTTNCSWAIKTIFLPAVEEHLKPQSNLRIMPWSPLELASFAKQAQKEFLKKYPNIIFKNEINAPKKNIYTRKEFLKIISEKSLSIKLQNALCIKEKNLESILILLEKYYRIADFQINYRLLFIEQIKEKLAIFSENIANNTLNNKGGKKISSINMLYQSIIIEEESLMACLMGIKGRSISKFTTQ
jgi:hypothetical protein